MAIGISCVGPLCVGSTHCREEAVSVQYALRPSTGSAFVTRAVPSLLDRIDKGGRGVVEGVKHVICDVLIKESVSTFSLFSKTTSLIFFRTPKSTKNFGNSFEPKVET